MANATFRLNGVHFGYADTPVLSGLDLSFEPGMVHGVVGPNGSGKSTLLALLSGHLKPGTGTIHLNDIPLTALSPATLSRLCALVPQELDFNFPFTVHETVLMGRHPHIPRLARPTDADYATVSASIDKMDLDKLHDRVLADLSGGEKQRAVVARGLAQETPALLLDEPTSSMDIRHALTTMSELKQLAHTKNRTIIAVLHDLNLAARFCDRIVMLHKGRVHAQGAVIETLTQATIETVFKVRASLHETEAGPQIVFIKEL